jgi:glutamyl-tRNA synthetase
MEDLIQRWRIDQVQKAGGKWDYERLKWFNGVWIRKLSEDELLERILPFLPAEWDRRIVRRTIPLIHERLETLGQARDWIRFLFEDVGLEAPALLPKGRSSAETRTVLSRAREALAAAGSFDKAQVESALKGVASGMGWKQGDVNMPARLAVTGARVGPPLYESIELLGRERTVQRIDRAVHLLDGSA